MFPCAERRDGVVEGRESLSARELFGINAVAALNLAVLLEAPWADVPMRDARLHHLEREGERKFEAVVALELANREGEGTAQLGEKRGKRKAFMAIVAIARRE